MDKVIYKLTNNVNGKVYIGQTNNLKRRIQEHKHDKRNQHPIYLAIQKYGFDNFSVEVLYEGSDFNKKEEEYIALYKSNNPEFGYNVLPGRINSNGELNPMAILTEELANNIINDIINTDLPITKIAEKFHIPVYFVNHLNHGKTFKKDNVLYPLRKSKTLYDKEIALNVIEDLKNNKLSIEDICNKYQIKRYTVLNINKGDIFVNPNEKYPIRELFLNKNIRDEIIFLLKNTKLSGKEIAEKIGIDKGIVYNINSGKTWFDENELYPIRKLNPMITTSNDRS